MARRRAVGVDIGATGIRVVEVRGIDAKGYAIVSKIGLVPLKRDVVAAGRIRNPVTVAQVLQRALKSAGVAPYGFVVGLSSPDVAVGEVSLPSAIRPNERVSALRHNNVEISPSVPLADAIVSTNKVETHEMGDGRNIDVLLTAASLRSDMEMLMKTMKLARCSPAAVDLAGAATMRALVRSVPTAHDVHTIIDIGATKTTVSTRRGLHLRSIRTVPVGGEQLVRSVMTVSNDSWEDAEARLRYLRLSSAPTAAPVNLPGGYGLDADEVESSKPSIDTVIDIALSDAAEQLIERIAQAIESDAAAHGGSFTSGIVVCGGAAQLAGLKERLHQRVGVPVQLGRPWAVVERSKGNLAYYKGGVEDPRLMMQLSTAIGLALWKDAS